MMPVGRMYRVAVLLANAHSCFMVIYLLFTLILSHRQSKNILELIECNILYLF